MMPHSWSRALSALCAGLWAHAQRSFLPPRMSPPRTTTALPTITVGFTHTTSRDSLGKAYLLMTPDNGVKTWGCAMTRLRRAGIVGAGPAGIYAADLLTKDETLSACGTSVSIDVLDKLPSPYGLVRYGVAPDHPRIKQIQKALHKILDKPEVTF